MINVKKGQSMKVLCTKRVSLFALIILLLGLLVSCSKKEAGEKETSPANSDMLTLKEESLKLIDLKTEKVSLKSIPVEFSASGVIGFNEKRLVHITSRVSGWVDKVYKFVGDKVRMGDSLVSIHSPEFLSAQGEFIQAEERLKSIPKTDSIDYRTASSLYQSAKAKLILLGITEIETKLLEDTHQPAPRLVIKSPLNGSIIESNMIAGNTVEKGANLFRLSDLSSLWVTANVYEKDISKIQRGQRVQIKVSSFPNKIFPGTVEAVNDVLDETTRTFKVRILVDNTSGDLKPEMFCECLFRGEISKKMLAIPSSALQNIEGENIVFVAQGSNSFEKRLVKTGPELSSYVEILEGLKVGEEVVTEGSFVLKSELLKGEMGEE